MSKNKWFWEELRDNVTEGGSEVLGAVGETVGEIGQNTMKPAEIVQERAHVRQEGGVLDAIGETIAEIAETTRVMVAGEDKRVMPETRVTDRAKHEERSESAWVSFFFFFFFILSVQIETSILNLESKW